ncbi:S1 family peptidase [Allokutzneria oryzae]|uniref:Trypsin-like serine protease n=1 Tax=Allokutzneria oryzae TaxID=1378989 RepID=A0ABV6A448_9PSEU
MTKRALIAAVALTAVFTPQAGAVARGVDVADGQYRFNARLTSGPTQVCTGALIGAKWVATALHCMASGEFGEAVIGATTSDGAGGQRRRVVSYTGSDQADFAVAELDRPAEGITPLLVGSTAPKPGDVVRLVGWGKTGGTEVAKRLQTGQFVVDRVDEWVLGVRGWGPNPNTSACASDSGGPYFAERPDGTAVLVSVENSGPLCPHSELETTSRVDPHAKWVGQLINKGATDR